MPTVELQRIVIDTCVSISAAILPQSIAAKAFSLALSNFQLVVSESALAELVDVIYRKKFDGYLSDEARVAFLILLSQSSENIVVTTIINDCVDPKDNQFLSLAVDSGAKIIISGDPHLTIMNPYRDISIMSPREFIESFKREG
jgi:putative PIN family toxin of toxin-antitoxin system